MKIKQKTISKVITFLILSLVISSCAYSSLQPETYSRDAAQEMRNVLYGEVVKVKTFMDESEVQEVCRRLEEIS